MMSDETRCIRRAILRVDGDGNVVVMNEAARQLLGDYSVGKPCHEVVGGGMQGDAPLCRMGCARELAFGLIEERGIVHARLRKRREFVKIECSRVGNDVHVVIDPSRICDATERLTERERRVLSLVARGLSSSQISKMLSIGVSTVRTHVEHARRRLGATTRAEAVLRALQTEQLDVDEVDGETTRGASSC